MFWRNKSLFFILDITLQSDLEPGVYLVGVITLLDIIFNNSLAPSVFLVGVDNLVLKEL